MIVQSVGCAFERRLIRVRRPARSARRATQTCPKLVSRNTMSRLSAPTAVMVPVMAAMANQPQASALASARNAAHHRDLRSQRLSRAKGDCRLWMAVEGEEGKPEKSHHCCEMHKASADKPCFDQGSTLHDTRWVSTDTTFQLTV